DSVARSRPVTRHYGPLRVNFRKRICCFEIVFGLDRLSARRQCRLRTRRIIGNANWLGARPSISRFVQREWLQWHTERPACGRVRFLPIRNPGADKNGSEECGEPPPEPHNRSCHAPSCSLYRAKLALATMARRQPISSSRHGCLYRNQCGRISNCAKRNEYGSASC